MSITKPFNKRYQDINEFDCIQWSSINADISNIKTHTLCIKCHKWYLRKSKFKKEKCFGCLGLEETKRIKSEYTFRCWDNDTSIVIQQRFRHGKSRSISIPLCSKNPQQFCTNLLDRLKGGLSWSEAKEDAQEFKRSNDNQSKIKTLIDLQNQFVAAQQTISQIIRDLGHEGS